MLQVKWTRKRDRFLQPRGFSCFGFEWFYGIYFNPINNSPDDWVNMIWTKEKKEKYFEITRLFWVGKGRRNVMNNMLKYVLLIEIFLVGVCGDILKILWEISNYLDMLQNQRSHVASRNAPRWLDTKIVRNSEPIPKNGRMKNTSRIVYSYSCYFLAVA